MKYKVSSLGSIIHKSRIIRPGQVIGDGDMPSASIREHIKSGWLVPVSMPGDDEQQARVLGAPAPVMPTAVEAKTREGAVDILSATPAPDGETQPAIEVRTEPGSVVPSIKSAAPAAGEPLKEPKPFSMTDADLEGLNLEQMNVLIADISPTTPPAATADEARKILKGE